MPRHNQCKCCGKHPVVPNWVKYDYNLAADEICDTCFMWSASYSASAYAHRDGPYIRIVDQQISPSTAPVFMM